MERTEICDIWKSLGKTSRSFRRLSGSFALPWLTERVEWEGEAPAEPQLGVPFSLQSSIGKGCSPGVVKEIPPHDHYHFIPASLRSKREHRCAASPRLTAVRNAFVVPTRTTNRFARVIAVYSKLRCNMM